MYANDDITLITESGELIFIPYGGLLKSGNPYYGKVTIKLSPYQHLLDSLTRSINNRRLIHPLQLASSIIACTDEQGRSLKINTRDGYQLLLFMPIAPAVAGNYGDSLIWKADDIFFRKNSFDSFGIQFNIVNLPGILQEDDMFALSKRALNPEFRKDGGLAYRKSKSIKSLRHFLNGYLANASGQFLRSVADKTGELQSDIPTNVPFIGFNILELYNKNGGTNLKQIFAEHKDQWKNSLLIMDWTGSMQAHREDIKMVLEDLYLKNTIRHIAIYNDVEDPDPPHLYDNLGFFTVDSVRSFSEVENLMNESEKESAGGSIEEGDFAALIRATSEKNPGWKSPYDQIIMLVDNNAPPRDKEIFNLINIKTNIYVIAYDAQNPCDVDSNYHKLVRKFGGLLIAEGLAQSHNCQDSTQERCMYDKNVKRFSAQVRLSH
jgi:hypothetical protein